MLITLFRVYFAINNLRLCKNLISAVESKQFPPFQAFPASQRVTYYYFLGRIQIYDEHYVSVPGCVLQVAVHYLRLRKHLISAVDSKQFPPFHTFSSLQSSQSCDEQTRLLGSACLAQPTSILRFQLHTG